MGRHRLTVGEIAAGHVAEIGLLTDHRRDKGFLVERRQQRASQLRIVERRTQVIERDDRLPSEGIVHRDQHAGRGPQHRAEIDQRLFDPVDLALLQGGGGGRRIRLHDPFDPLEMRHLAARVETRRFLTRHVAIEARITRTGAGNPLAGEEPERPRSNRFLDLLGGRRLRHALGHHEAASCAKSVEHLTERLFQPDLEPPVVDGNDFIRHPRQLLAERIARGPTLQRHHAVLRQDLFAVVEGEPVAQRERPGQLVGRNVVPRAHLRLHLVAGVDPVQRIVNQITMRLWPPTRWSISGRAT